MRGKPTLNIVGTSGRSRSWGSDCKLLTTLYRLYQGGKRRSSFCVTVWCTIHVLLDPLQLSLYSASRLRLIWVCHLIRANRHERIECSCDSKPFWVKCQHGLLGVRGFTREHWRNRRRSEGGRFRKVDDLEYRPISEHLSP